MAIEDSYVLADELRRGSDIPAALIAFTQRKPRVGWVREQSHAQGQLIPLPAATRDRALRERGAAVFYDRYRPPAAAP